MKKNNFFSLNLKNIHLKIILYINRRNELKNRKQDEKSTFFVINDKIKSIMRIMIFIITMVSIAFVEYVRR